MPSDAKTEGLVPVQGQLRLGLKSKTEVMVALTFNPDVSSWIS